MLSQKRLNNLALCFLLTLTGATPLLAQAQHTRPRRVQPPAQEPQEAQESIVDLRTGQQTPYLAVPTLTNDDVSLPPADSMGAYYGIQRSMLSSIQALLGTPYRYGGMSNNGIDCSGFVWRVFSEAGFDLARTSAADMYFNLPEPEAGDETRFGTLVFFNNLTHVGIVRDKDTFYHASRTHGVTLSSFKGYWQDRIVGYRVVPLAE